MSASMSAHMSAIVIIPARLAATRLPGKPLADIGGAPMIVRVVRQALAADVGRVAVAAGDSEIVGAVKAAGAEAVMTDPQLPSGSDRIMAALQILDPQERHDVVINLQGDMPFVDPQVLGACIRLLGARPECDIATAVAAESSPADRSNPDVVKAVLSLKAAEGHGRALYFTRSTLYGEAPVWRHIGIYAYRRQALESFTRASPSPLELREKLEQLRALEMGLQIWASILDEAPISVDTPADLEAARAYAAGA